MASSAGLEIVEWGFTALNPDGSPNAFLNSISSGSVPADAATETIDFLAMGGRIRLSLVCELSGSHPDTTVRSVKGSTIRYNPGTYLEYLGIFYPPGTFPQGGYSIQIPTLYSSSYEMVLIGQAGNLNSNINGEVEMTIAGDQDFTIIHDFYLTADTESYPAGKYSDNFFRLSKNSLLASEEGTIDRPSVFGYLKGLNCNIVMRQAGYTVFAEDLSIPIQASFAGNESDGTVSSLECAFTIERLLVPGTEETTLSPFEDNLIKITVQDDSALIQEDESELIFVCRNLNQNVSTWIVDLQMKQVKLVTSGSSTQLDGPIYSPVTWSQGGGITEITFVIDGTKLQKNSLYQVHFSAGVSTGPSSARMVHFISEVIPSTGAPIEVPFTMESEFWTRNGKHAESFSIVPGERCTSVLSMNATEYDASVIDPWLTFAGDIDRVSVEVIDEEGETVFSEEIVKNDDDTFTGTEFIGLEIESGPSTDTIYHFFLKEFRIPFTNFQSLPDWTDKDFNFRWKALFIDQRSDEYSGEYVHDTFLTVTHPDNDNVSPHVENVNFLNPETLEIISDWSELSTILVTAQVDPVGPNTYITVMVDKYPLGALMFNDFALEEENPTEHSLPDWVIFEQRVSDLVSDVPAQPTEGGISFLLDVSELSGESNYTIYIQAYEA